MPLIIAHPVAVLPFRRWGLPLSALVVGSISPDLEYLIRLSPVSEFSHTMAGLFWFCLPASLFILWIFHRIWLPAAVSLAPDITVCGQGKPGTKWTITPLGRFALLCGAILLGAVTHIVWDSFTHEYGWMVLRLPALSKPAFTTAWGSVPIFKILQHGSTLLGLGILANLAVRYRVIFQAIPTSVLKRVALVICADIGLAIGYGLFHTRNITDIPSFARLLGLSIVLFFALLIVEATVAGLAWKFNTHAAACGDLPNQRNGPIR